MTTDTAISVRGLGKRYKRINRARSHDSLRDLIQANVADLFANKSAREERFARDHFWALKDVNFDIKKGENVGIIGLNGAGKSTLLKVLSRIVTPTEGTARIEGRLGALLEVGTGFHHELTGRENTFLYGSILGMSREEVAAKYDQIVEFSEIAEFMDTPVKRYSSGMYVRLAFAVAAHLDPEILLLDEVLAVGDFTFQRKCINFTKSLEQKGATILVVSHNMFSIKSMCDRVIYLRKGQVVFDGPVEEGLTLYENDSKLAPTYWFGGNPADMPVTITGVTLENGAGEETSVFEHGQPMRVRVAYNARRRVERPDFRVAIARSDQVHMMTFSTFSDNADIPFIEGEGVLELTTPPMKLTSDVYHVDISVRERGFGELLVNQNGGTFHISHPVFAPVGFGVFHEPGTWRVPGASAQAPEKRGAG
jgi:lipopolysaccharide transport system ATP-binding protein